MSGSAEDAGPLQEHLSAGDQVLVVVAGPNGAGKTTFVDTFLKTTGLRIVNPDQIARALAPDAPETVAYEAAQLADTVRRDLLARGASFCMETEPEAWKMDPEQILLSPIFDDGHRLIFEFRRAHILSVNRRGDLETRLVAVDPVRGIVGTKTIHRFNTRLTALATRCVEHLAGAVDLFPPREHTPPQHRGPIPPGEANLSFGSPGRPRHQSSRKDSKEEEGQSNKCHNMAHYG